MEDGAMGDLSLQAACVHNFLCNVGHCCKCYPCSATLRSVTIQVTAHDISSLLTAPWPFHRELSSQTRDCRGSLSAGKFNTRFLLQVHLLSIGASTWHAPSTSWLRRDASQKRHCRGHAEHAPRAQHHACSCPAREAACGKALHSQRQLSGPRLLHSFSTS